jgi:hypothetical protein
MYAICFIPRLRRVSMQLTHGAELLDADDDSSSAQSSFELLGNLAIYKVTFERILYHWRVDFVLSLFIFFVFVPMTLYNSLRIVSISA